MEGKGLLNQLMNQSVTELFVEQPLASPGSANKKSQTNLIHLTPNLLKLHRQIIILPFFLIRFEKF